MGLVDLTSDLAVNAGNPIGSPTGNNMGSSTAPQAVDYFPNIHATGFTMNFGGPPTLFTMNGVPEVVDTNPIGRHTAGMDVPSFNMSDVTTLQQQTTPFEISDVTSFQQSTNPFEQSNITDFTTPDLIDWFQVSIDNSPMEQRAPRQPFNFPSLETPEAYDYYSANGKVESELEKPAYREGQYDKLPIRDNNVIGFDQPFIIKDIGNKAGIDAISGVPGLGMVSTMIGRATDDVFRIGKFLLTPQGIMFGAKQWFFHKMNAFPHTRQWNPESLFSIVPMVHIPTHGKPGSVVIGPVAEKMQPYIEGLANKGTEVIGNLADLIGEKAADAWTFGGEVKDWAGVTIDKAQSKLTPIIEKFKHYFPQQEPKVTESAPPVEAPNKGIDWDKVKQSGKDIWEKVQTSAIKIGQTTSNLATKAADLASSGIYWAKGQIGHLTSDPVMSYMRSQLSGGTHSRHQDSWFIIASSKAQGAGISPGSTNSRLEIPSMIGNEDNERLIHLNTMVYGLNYKYTEHGLPVHTKELKSNFDTAGDGSPILWLHRGIMWKHSSKATASSEGIINRHPALEPQKGRFFKLTDSPLAEMIHHRNIGRDFPNGDNAVDIMLPPTIKTDDDIVKRYALMSYGQIPGDDSQKYQSTLRGPSETAKSILDDEVTTKELKTLEKEIGRRKEGQKKVYAIGSPGKPGMKPVEDTKLGLIKKGDVDSFTNELTDKVNMTPYGSETDMDFIPFKFKDLVNGKFIQFRATLEGISDTVTPGWNESQYIGRPDKVYTYTGADRAVGFSFKVYPMSKQEMIPMWEKLNYLMGLGYPQFKSAGDTGGRLMTPPFIELTIGNLYKNTPGILDSIALTIEDNSPWDIDVPMQLPKFVSVQIGFKFIGNYALSMTGKHFELPWLSGTEEFGTFATDPQSNENQDPVRIDPDKTYTAIQNSGRG
tara:strand:- start:4377 stop:7169 length:2793 start_codon:yes stop_codon:yes gene_type:complete